MKEEIPIIKAGDLDEFPTKFTRLKIEDNISEEFLKIVEEKE